MSAGKRPPRPPRAGGGKKPGGGPGKRAASGGGAARGGGPGKRGASGGGPAKLRPSRGGGPKGPAKGRGAAGSPASGRGGAPPEGGSSGGAKRAASGGGPAKGRSSGGAKRAASGGGPPKGRSSGGAKRGAPGGAGRGAPPARRAAPPGADAPRRDVIYGRNPVNEAIRAGARPVRQVLATQAAAKDFPRAKVVAAEELDALAGTDAHQGVVAKVGPYPYADAGELLALDTPLIVALDEVQDPQNLGAIARTAECAGAHGLVVPERRAAEVTAAAAKASAGAVEHLPVARVRNLADFLADAKAKGLWVYGADENAKTRYDQADWEGGLVLVLGAEGKGLRPRVRAHCDLLVSLPLKGRIGSLNVSAAAAVLLYQAASRR